MTTTLRKPLLTVMTTHGHKYSLRPIFLKTKMKDGVMILPWGNFKDQLWFVTFDSRGIIMGHYGISTESQMTDCLFGYTTAAQETCSVQMTDLNWRLTAIHPFTFSIVQATGIPLTCTHKCTHAHTHTKTNTCWLKEGPAPNVSGKPFDCRSLIYNEIPAVSV